MAKMIFARKIDTGMIVGIDEVERGLACNCVCPCCNERLEARKGQKNIHHFAHSGNNEPSFCSETALHLAAKEILKESREISLPELRIGDEKYGKSFLIWTDGNKFSYEYVELEKNIVVDDEIIRPDAVAHNGNAVLGIEVLVSHAVDDDKRQKIKKAELTTIEVDLGLTEIFSKEDLKRVLLEETFNKKWIFSNQAIYFQNKIKANCNKRSIENSQIKNCPLEIWQGKQRGIHESKCHECKYCYRITPNNVFCLGEKRISKINDLKLNDDKLREYIEHQERIELDGDRINFENGICPVCHSTLRLSNAGSPYISCRNYKECKFTASIDLDNNLAVYKNRKAKKAIAKLPDFVHKEVEALQKNAMREMEDIEKIFSDGLCPYCMEELVIREGEFGAFLGCEGHNNVLCNCRFKAQIDPENMMATFQTRYSPKRTIVKPIPENVIKEYNKK